MVAILVALALFILFSSSVNALSLNYYDKTCPRLESTITSAVKNAMINDKTVPAALLRMHFHDCFITGCDATVLLASKGNQKAERDGPPNISLHAFYVIDNVKKAVEALCPGLVSCADILALAARDAVALSGGPTWLVPKGRKDGRISRAIDTRQLPSPTFNISQLQQSFSQRGLSLKDLVALSGGHTLGFAHCSSFQNRIHNFNASFDIDPSLQPSFAASLRSICLAHNKTKNAGATLDSTTATFDNVYYKLLLQGKSIFSSDQALLTTPKTKALVSKFASSQQEFDKAFVNGFGGYWRRVQKSFLNFVGSGKIERVPDPGLFSTHSYNRRLALPTAGIVFAGIRSKIGFVEWHASRGGWVCYANDFLDAWSGCDLIVGSSSGTPIKKGVVEAIGAATLVEVSLPVTGGAFVKEVVATYPLAASGMEKEPPSGGMAEEASLVRYASYSTALFEHGNSSLKDNGMVSSSSQLSIIPRPFEVVVADPSNLMIHFFHRSSVTATSLRISSLSEHSSSPGNWASRSTMAWLLTALGVLKPMSY
ncbi:peroxidase 64 [Quercus suber]|uniref:peroxidase 64 n=1 Tax=Quercus suber TaxID=58331 RepID=UPI0032DFBB62